MTGAGLRAKESASKSSWLLSSGSAHEKSSTRLLPERVPPSMRTVGPFGVDCASSSSARAGQPPASRSSLLMSSGLKPHLAAEPWSQSGASSTSRTSRRSSVSRQKIIVVGKLPGLVRPSMLCIARLLRHSRCRLPRLATRGLLSPASAPRSRPLNPAETVDSWVSAERDLVDPSLSLWELAELKARSS